MTSSDPTSPSPPRVFISYSHDSDEHRARVLALAEQLRRDGIDARIDQYQTSPSEGWPLWCARQILAANFVLLVCTKSYRERFLGLDAFGRGRGVKWEGKIIQNILYYDEISTGFIPVVFEPGDDEYIPETVKEASWVHIQTTSFEESGYGSLRLRLGGRRRLPPLDPIQPLEAFRRRDGASVPTQEVWDASERIAAKLDKIQSDQTEHEQRSAHRHRVVVFWQRVLAVLLACAVGGAAWFKIVTERIVTDPIVLRSKLEQKIDESFSQKLATAKAQGAPYQEIDQLYRWRDQTLARLDESVKFIQAAADERQSSLSRKAAAVLQERGVDAALESLQKALAEEGKRHKAQARELAEAALFKAELHEARFEFEQARQSIEEAVQFDYTWSEPHNRSGLLALHTARWGDSEKAFNNAERFVKGETDRAVVLNNLAQLLQATNRLSEAEPLMRRALQIHEKSFGPEHSNVAITLNNLAMLLYSANRLFEAEPLMRRALEIDVKSFGPEHPDVARDLNNLAQFLKDTNRLTEAESLMRRALQIDEKSFGPEHPNVARVLNNLASLLQDTNRLAEAEPLMRRALEIDEKSLGPEHPNVARDLNNLAQFLKDTNRLTEAESLMGRALQIGEKCFGPEHPEVAITINNLASLLQATNRLTEAEPLMRRALQIDEKSFGPDNPSVARDLNSLATLLYATNRLPEAEPLMQRAIEIAEKCFGPEHPNVAITINNLASLLQATNRLTEAEPLIRRALQIDERSFGPDQPNVAIRLNNLATLLQATNRLSEAEPLIRRALQIDEKGFGPEHPEVATDLNNLAQLLQSTNRLSEAEPLIRRALQIDEKSFGPEHPKVAIRINNLAQLLQSTNRLSEAEPLMRRALQIDEKSFGPEHPNVARDLNNLAQLLKASYRLSEAEPLMRRTSVILLEFTLKTGHEHPHLAKVLGNHRNLLKQMSLPEDQISERLAEVGKEAGFDDEGFARLLEQIFSEKD